MNFDDLKEIFGYLIAGLVAIVAWFGKREINRLDEDRADHEERIRKIEDLTSQIMTGPQVMALYAEQREDHREKFKELRLDLKEQKAELAARLEQQSAKIDKIFEKVVKRLPNERENDP